MKIKSWLLKRDLHISNYQKIGGAAMCNNRETVIMRDQM